MARHGNGPGRGGFLVIAAIVLALAGIGLMLYPAVSQYINTLHSSRTIRSYQDIAANVPEQDFSDILSAARRYNRDLMGYEDRFYPTEDWHARYLSLLDLTGSGVMGYVEIPDLKLKLPVYHGTSETVLQTAIGHIEGSSLPVGGAGTHVILSGHRGLPSAKLFTELDKLEIGDRFILHALNLRLTYEVDDILVVLPEEVESLKIYPDQDYCTLVTCTPYGVNSHRLLVRGSRVESEEDDVVTSAPEASGPTVLSDDLIWISAAAGGLFLLILVVHGARRLRRPKGKRVAVRSGRRQAGK